MNNVYDNVNMSKDKAGNYKMLNDGSYLTPTLKEINIKSAEDLKTVYEFMKDEGDKHLIGFTDLDSWMSSMEQAYKPSKLDGWLSDVVIYLQFAQKLLMRLKSFLMALRSFWAVPRY